MKGGGRSPSLSLFRRGGGEAPLSLSLSLSLSLPLFERRKDMTNPYPLRRILRRRRWPSFIPLFLFRGRR
jgi:hypothetical protein